MKKSLWSWVVVVGSIAAQDGPQSTKGCPEPPDPTSVPRRRSDEPTVAVPQTARLTKRVLLVVDVSGSMIGKLSTAVRAALRIAGSGVDELEVAAIAFSDETARWTGVVSDGCPPRWAALPSEEAIGELVWFLERRGTVGDTHVIPALREALAEPRGDLSVVLISDGIFQSESSPEILRAIDAAQSWRTDAGHGRAVVMTWCVGPEKSVMNQIGEAHAGGSLVSPVSH